MIATPVLGWRACVCCGLAQIHQLSRLVPLSVRVDQMSVGPNDFLPNDVEPKWHLEVVDGVVNLRWDAEFTKPF